MSLPSLITSRRVKKSAVATLGLSGVLFVASMFAQPSGAWFFDQKQINVTGSTGGLGLQISGGTSSGAEGSLILDLGSIAPGFENQYSFSVTNTGTVAGTLRASINHNYVNGFEGNADLLTSKIAGDFNGEPFSLSGVPTDLMTLNPGVTRTFQYQVALSPSADNAWQNAAISDTVALALEQVRN